MCCGCQEWVGSASWRPQDAAVHLRICPGRYLRRLNDRYRRALLSGHVWRATAYGCGPVARPEKRHRRLWVGTRHRRTSAVWQPNLTGSFRATSSGDWLAGPDLKPSLAVPRWPTAMQRKEPVASACFLAAQLHESWIRSAAVRVGRRPTLRTHPLSPPRRPRVAGRSRSLALATRPDGDSQAPSEQ